MGIVSEDKYSPMSNMTYEDYRRQNITQRLNDNQTRWCKALEAIYMINPWQHVLAR